MLSTGAVVALLQEPWTVHGSVRGLPRGMRVYATGDTPKAAVVVNDSHAQCMLMHELSDEHGVCVRVEWGDWDMFCVSMYCPPSVGIRPYVLYLDRVLPHIGGRPFILGMDANALSPLWHSKTAPGTSYHRAIQRGEALADFLLSHCLHVLNVPSSSYTYCGPRGSSDIDVTVANESMCRYVRRWWIDGGWGVSDHNLIEIQLGPRRRCVPDAEPLNLRWKSSVYNWEAYRALLLSKVDSLPLQEFRLLPVAEKVALLRVWVHEVCDCLFERVTQRNPVHVAWWNRALTEKRREVRRARSRWQKARARSADNVQPLRARMGRAVKEYRVMLADAKERHWRDFVRGTANDPWGQAYKLCRGKGSTLDVAGVRVEGNPAPTWKECVGALFKEFFPGTTDAVNDLDSFASENPSPLQSWEIDASVARLRSKRSPGWDGMTGEMCRNIWSAIPSYVECLFEECFRMEHFPEEYKVARVVVLRKASALDMSSPRSYRPISLLPALGKVLERIMVQRLEERLATSMSDRQYGFRKGRSTEDAWRYLCDVVGSSECKYVLGLFVDFKGAFDYLCWSAVLNKLREIECQEIGLWRSYFSNRKAFIQGSVDRVDINVQRGCPQGSVAGPFIWNMMMDGLLDQLSVVCPVCAYADDLLVLVRGNSRLELERVGAAAMRKVVSWGESVGVMVSESKTCSMLLKGKLDVRRPPTIPLYRVSVRMVTQVTYLGVVMGERMIFTPHWRAVKERLTKVVSGIRRVLRVDWGLSRRATRSIYSSVFVACAAYCSSVLYKSLSIQRNSRIVLSCQRVMLYACIPVCRTVSTEAMQVLMGAPPLDLEITRRAIAFKLARGIRLSEDDWMHAVELSSVSRRERNNLLLEQVVCRWQERWDSSVNGRVTYQWLADVGEAMSRADMDFGLHLGFLMTGHGSLNSWLYSRGLSESRECPSCRAAEEDWLHVLLMCPAYSSLRGELGTSFCFNVACSMIACGEGLSALKAFANGVFAERRRLIAVAERRLTSSSQSAQHSAGA